MVDLRGMSARLHPELQAIRGRLTEEQPETRAELHISFLVTLLDELRVGGRARIKQLVGARPMAGNLGEPRVSPTQPSATPPMSREHAFKDGSLIFSGRANGACRHDGTLREGTEAQATKMLVGRSRTARLVRGGNFGVPCFWIRSAEGERIENE